MDLDAFLNKKGKKLAGSKKKAKTAELSEKERLELGLDAFGGLEDDVGFVAPAKTGNNINNNNNNNNNNNGNNDNNGGGAVQPSTEGDATGATPPSNNASVENTTAAASVDAVKTAMDTTTDERNNNLNINNDKNLEEEVVVVKVVKTAEKKTKGWDAVKAAAAPTPAEEVTIKAEPQKFVARGKGDSTGPLGGKGLSTADLPTLEDVINGNTKKAEAGPVNTETTGECPTASSGAHKPPTGGSSASAYKPPIDKPSAGAYKPPIDKPSAGTYKPPTGGSSAGTYKPPIDKPSSGNLYRPPNRNSVPPPS